MLDSTRVEQSKFNLFALENLARVDCPTAWLSRFGLDLPRSKAHAVAHVPNRVNSYFGMVVVIIGLYPTQSAHRKRANASHYRTLLHAHSNIAQQIVFICIPLLAVETLSLIHI